MKNKILIGLVSAGILGGLAVSTINGANADTKTVKQPTSLNAEDKKEDKAKTLDVKKSNNSEIYDYSNKAEGEVSKTDKSIVVEKAKDPKANAKKAGVYVDGEKEKVVEKIREERDKAMNEKAKKDLATKTEGTIEFSDLTIERPKGNTEKIEELQTANKDILEETSKDKINEAKKIAKDDLKLELNDESAARAVKYSKENKVDLKQAITELSK